MTAPAPCKPPWPCAPTWCCWTLACRDSRVTRWPGSCARNPPQERRAGRPDGLWTRVGPAALAGMPGFPTIWSSRPGFARSRKYWQPWASSLRCRPGRRKPWCLKPEDRRARPAVMAWLACTMAPHAHPSRNQSRCAPARPAGHSLVRPDLPGGLWPVLFPGQPAPAPRTLCLHHRAGRLVAQGHRRHFVSGRDGRGARRAAGLLPVLQAGLLPHASAGNLLRLAGRHELSWRHAGRAGVAALVCALAPPALAAGDGLHRALRADRAGRRARGELHQWRAVGPLQRA